MPDYTLNVNGTPRTVLNVPADMPLLYVLRDVLDPPVTGPKYGCGIGVCGACTSHIGTNTVARLCITPISEVGQRPITTIEGLAVGDVLHPVQEAWLYEDVAQCGYCQAGQIMTAVALIAQNPDPSDADIDAAMAENVCRCGTYVRIRAAIKRAADAIRAAG